MKNILNHKRFFLIILFYMFNLLLKNLNAQSFILSPDSLEGKQSNSQSNLLFTGASNPFLRKVNTAIASGRITLILKGIGHTGAGFLNDSNTELRFNNSQTWSSTENGNKMVFVTNGIGCGNCAHFFVIDNSGRMGFDRIGGTGFSAFNVKRSNTNDVPTLSNASISLMNFTVNYLQIASPDNTGSGIMFGKPSGLFSGGINYTPNLDLQFQTANNVRLVVAQTGKIGIGTLTPTATLDVAGTYGFSGRLSITGTQNNLDVSNQSVIYVNGATSTLSGILGGVDGRILHIVVEDNTDLTIQTLSTNSAIGNRIYTGQSTNLLISNGGGLTLIYDAGNFIWRVIDARP